MVTFFAMTGYENHGVKEPPSNYVGFLCTFAFFFKYCLVVTYILINNQAVLLWAFKGCVILYIFLQT